MRLRLRASVLRLHSCGVFAFSNILLLRLNLEPLAGCDGMHVRMYVCMTTASWSTCSSLSASRPGDPGDVCMYTCVYARTYVPMYLCTYVCMYVRTCVRMCICMYGQSVPEATKESVDLEEVTIQELTERRRMTVEERRELPFSCTHCGRHSS